MGCFGGGGGGGGDSQSARDSVNLQREQVQKQYEYDLKNYEFNWGSDTNRGEQYRQLAHTRDGLRIKRENDELNKTYQEETSTRNWEHSVSIQDYEFLQGLRGYAKSEEQAQQQFGMNTVAAQAAINRETEVLNEQFIESAFQNQGLIQDLYETVGGKGYDKAAQQLGLKNTQGQLDYNKLNQLQNLQQRTEASKFDTAGTQLSLVDKKGKTQYNKAGMVQDLMANEAQRKLQKLEVGLDAKSAKTRADYENDIIRRNLSDQYAKAAFDTTERNVEALQRLGAASAVQSGRSQGKAVQMVLAAIGRQNAYTVETLIRGTETADANARQNRIQALNTRAKAQLASTKIDFATLDQVAKTKLGVEEADRDLKISGSKTELDLDKIKQQIMHATESADLEVKEIDRKIDRATTEAGFNMKKIDWDVENVGSRFKTNQHILKAQIDSAVKSAVFNKQDIARKKLQADLEVEARRLLRPNEPPRIPPPLKLPDLEWQDPLTPNRPPEPIKGALARMPSGGGGGGFVDAASSVLGAVSTGFGIASIGALGALATPLGVVAGIGSLLFG